MSFLLGGAYTNNQNSLKLNMISTNMCETLTGQQVADSFMCLQGQDSFAGNSCEVRYRNTNDSWAIFPLIEA